MIFILYLNYIPMEKNKRYKLMLIIPVIILLFSVGVLVTKYTTTGEWVSRSIELKGGTLIDIRLSSPPDIQSVESALGDKYGDILIKEARGITGDMISIQTEAGVDTDLVLADLEGIGIDTSQSSIGTIGPALGETFFSQAQTGIIVAFIVMGIIVFGLFRRLIPSFAVMLAAVSDIVVTIALMQVFGISMSLAGIAAILMLIGYSVDTDIMLTSRLLKDSGEVVKKIKRALKTGLTMSLTSIGALAALLISSVSPVLSEIAAVLLIGLCIDIVNTWLQNSVLLRWHLERRGVE